MASSLAIGKIYEGLLQYAYLDRPYRVEPLLAEALPEVSEDGLLYTLQRPPRASTSRTIPASRPPGGKGRELSAEDFVYSIKRVADLKNDSNGFWAFNDRIVGLDDFRARLRRGGAHRLRPDGRGPAGAGSLHPARSG